MRKALLLLAVSLVVLIVAVAGIGSLLPVEHVATRSAVVARRPGVVHAVLTDVQAFPAWRSGLTGVDVIEAGKRWRERSDDGDITFELVESRPPDRLVTRIADDTLPFGGTWTFDLAPDQNGTRVTITENGEVFNPVFRFMSRFVFGHAATIDTYLADLAKHTASMPDEGTRQKSAVQPDAAKTCDSCGEWNAPLQPFRVFGNTYYVGTAGLSAVLITSNAGHVLLDGALPQSAPLIAESIGTLGFQLADVRLILTSHEHFDHAGGIAALQRASGATVVSSAAAAPALQRGGPLPSDPQFGMGLQMMSFPPIANVRAVRDGEVISLGDLRITAHATPGHTPGGASWTWKSCEAARCLDVVYADSLNAVSAPGFRFTGEGGRGSIVDSFRATIAKVAGLPCDIVLSVHPGFTALTEKLARRTADASVNPFVDREGCRAYAADAAKRLDRRVSEEK